MRFAAFPLAAAIAVPAVAQTVPQAPDVDRHYIMECGHNSAPDQSHWSGGVDVGKPIELSDNCCLIRHGARSCRYD
jgi:N-acyl homoserine lactone hydrolase